MVSNKITTKAERENWSIEQYTDLLDKLYDIKYDMHEDTWNLLHAAIRHEVRSKFTEEERTYQRMDF